MQDDNWESFMALYEACMIARDRLYVHQSQSSKETVKKLDAAILKAESVIRQKVTA